jgi:hypothetical protein
LLLRDIPEFDTMNGIRQTRFAVILGPGPVGTEATPKRPNFAVISPAACTARVRIRVHPRASAIDPFLPEYRMHRGQSGFGEGEFYRGCTQMHSDERR